MGIKASILGFVFCCGQGALGAAVINSITVSPGPLNQGGTVQSPILYYGMTDAVFFCPSGSQQCDSCSKQSFHFGSSSNFTSTMGPLCSVKEMVNSSSNNIVITMNFVPSTATYSSGTQTAFNYYVSIGGNTVTNSSDTLVSVTGPTSWSSTTQAITVSYTIPWVKICAGSTITNSGVASLSSCLGSFSTTVNVGWGTSNTFTDSGSVTFNYRYVATQSATAVSASSPPESPWATFGTTGPTTADWEGFYSFNAFPGDSKIYITNPIIYSGENYDVGDYQVSLGAAPTQADGSTLKYSGMRVYYVQASSSTAGDFRVDGGGNANGSTQGYADLSYSGGSLSPAYVSAGITNLTGSNEYQISIASMDQAGILTFFTNPAKESFALTPTGSTQAAQPQPVYGVLEGQGCFIATAAYGSALAPQIHVFREFRSRILLPSDWGRKFVAWYYRNSPEAAVWINESEVRKTIARGLLWPVLIGSKLALAMGLGPALFMLGLLASSVVVLMITLMRRKRRFVHESRHD